MISEFGSCFDKCRYEILTWSEIIFNACRVDLFFEKRDGEYSMPDGSGFCNGTVDWGLDYLCG